MIKHYKKELFASVALTVAAVATAIIFLLAALNVQVGALTLSRGAAWGLFGASITVAILSGMTSGMLVYANRSRELSESFAKKILGTEGMKKIEEAQQKLLYHEFALVEANGLVVRVLPEISDDEESVDNDVDSNDGSFMVVEDFRFFTSEKAALASLPPDNRFSEGEGVSYLYSADPIVRAESYMKSLFESLANPSFPKVQLPENPNCQLGNLQRYVALLGHDSEVIPLLERALTCRFERVCEAGLETPMEERPLLNHLQELDVLIAWWPNKEKISEWLAPFEKVIEKAQGSEGPMRVNRVGYVPLANLYEFTSKQYFQFLCLKLGKNIIGELENTRKNRFFNWWVAYEMIKRDPNSETTRKWVETLLKPLKDRGLSYYENSIRMHWACAGKSDLNSETQEILLQLEEWIASPANTRRNVTIRTFVASATFAARAFADRGEKEKAREILQRAETQIVQPEEDTSEKQSWLNMLADAYQYLGDQGKGDELRVAIETPLTRESRERKKEIKRYSQKAHDAWFKRLEAPTYKWQRLELLADFIEACRDR